LRPANIDAAAGAVEEIARIVAGTAGPEKKWCGPMELVRMK
jgi:hypothetical protein